MAEDFGHHQLLDYAGLEDIFNAIFISCELLG